MELSDVKIKKSEKFEFELTYQDSIMKLVSKCLRRYYHPKRSGISIVLDKDSLSSEEIEELRNKLREENSKLENKLCEFGDMVCRLKDRKETKEIVSFDYKAPAVTFSIKVYPKRYFWKHWKMQCWWLKYNIQQYR